MHHHRGETSTRPRARHSRWVRPLRLVAAVGVLLLVGGGVATGNAGASGEQTANETVYNETVYEEYLTPSAVVVPGEHDPAELRLIDELTGSVVPLAAGGVVAEGGQSTVALPQLPVGWFSVEYPGGTLRLGVAARDGSFALPAPSTPNRLPLYVAGALVLVILAVGVKLRQRRTVAVLALSAAGVLGGAIVLLGQPQPKPLEAAWTACGLEGDEDARLLCKIAELVERLEKGEIDEVRTALATNRDPSCHEAVHAASYHIWRTTRDLDRAATMLLPGCDDGLIHGISEAMATFSSDGEFPDLLQSFCDTATEAYARTACYHGGGHAAIWRSNGDLEGAFGLCDRFPVREDFNYDVRIECKGSAVMEWSERWSRERAGTVKTLRPDVTEPMTICLDGPADELFRLGCYLGTNFRVVDAAGAARWCNERETFTRQCFEALGENLPYFETPFVNIELTAERAFNHLVACGGARNTADRGACVQSAVRVYTVMRLSLTDGEALCSLVAMPDREACAAGLQDARERLADRGIDLG